MSEYGHISVLYEETLQALALRPGGRYIDATINGGGHSEGILEATSPDGLLLGLDADPDAIAAAGQRLARFGSRATLVNENFAALRAVAERTGFVGVDGIVFDLGLSSRQLAAPARGFSFSSEGPLDMRFNPSVGESAADLVANLSEAELATVLREYGEEPHARAIARAIVRARGQQPITTTRQLADIVQATTPRRPGGIHPATRTFQALRIAVNRELDVLASGLRQAVELLAPGGRVAVIAFHSLEDRIVKQFFAEEARGCICPPKVPVCICQHKARLELLTRKPIMPTAAEIDRNPRSRSARLRVARALA